MLTCWVLGFFWGVFLGPKCFEPHLLVLKDVLGRISKQPSELESHADRLYDAILASLDMLAGCTLIPDNTPVAHRSTDVKGISLVSRQPERRKRVHWTPVPGEGTELLL